MLRTPCGAIATHQQMAAWRSGARVYHVWCWWLALGTAKAFVPARTSTSCSLTVSEACTPLRRVALRNRSEGSQGEGVEIETYSPISDWRAAARAQSLVPAVPPQQLPPLIHHVRVNAGPGTTRLRTILSYLCEKVASLVIRRGRASRSCAMTFIFTRRA